MSQKIRAFTILEMLISIGIMTIIVSMVYFVYVSFSGQVYRYFKGTVVSNDIYGFYSQFRVDAYKACKINRQGNELKLIFYDKNDVLYYFSDKELVREEKGQREKIPLFSYNFTNLNVKAENSKILNLVRKINYETELLGRKIQFVINKEYPPHFLIKFDGNRY